MQIQRRSVAAAVAALMGVSSFALADAVLIQPAEAQSKDTFVYSSLAAQNFEVLPGFNTILVSGRGNNNHDLRTLIQFDLGGAALGPGGIATFNLFVTTGAGVGFPVIDPAPLRPIVAEVFAVTGAWEENTVTWASQPTYGAAAIDSETIDGIGRYVSFDVTSQVQAWLADPSTNFGFSVQQPALVTVPGGSVQAVYHASANANPPFLYVGPVPEPSSTAVVAAAVLPLIARRRRG